MNVGILTFHMAHNCGAMLQTYALCRIITELMPCLCEVIDYRLPEIFNKYDRLLHTDPIPPRRLKFDRYMKKSLPLSKRVDDLSKATGYDLFVIGSDQVWNPKITHGYKEAYFANCFPSDSYCISYAASTGSHIVAPKAFCRKLDHFKYLSVRESWAKKELAPYYAGEIVWCLDPVLLLDAEQWRCPLPRRDVKDYILIYAFEVAEHEYQNVEKWAKQERLNIIELVTHERPKRQSIIYEDDYGPEEFVAFIQGAAYIYTDSYHGVLFSIIFQKPFYCLRDNCVKNERVNDVRERLSVKKNQYDFYAATPQTPQRLTEGRAESIDFLRTALEQVAYEQTAL